MFCSEHARKWAENFITMTFTKGKLGWLVEHFNPYVLLYKKKKITGLDVHQI
jgi:hypothetical protein